MRRGEFSTQHVHERREQQEQEQKRNKETIKSAFLWAERLIPELTTRGIPKHLRPSSALLPSMLVSTMMACAPGTIVECQQTDTDYIQGTKTWVKEHPNLINREFKQIWGTSRVNAKDIVNALDTAEIVCAIDAKNGIHTDEASTAAMHQNGTIYLFVDEHDYQLARDDYLRGEWAKHLSPEERRDIIQTDHELGDEVFDYANGLIYSAGTLFHEAAHILLGSHSRETKKDLEEIIESGGNVEELGTLDRIYGWGIAAENAVITREYLSLAENQ